MLKRFGVRKDNKLHTSSVRVMLTFLALAFIMICSIDTKWVEASQDLSVIKGEMNAPQWSFANDSPLEIKGDWEVIWGELHTPQSFSKEYSGDYFYLPNRWNQVSKPGKEGAFGVATFRARLMLPEYGLPVAFHMIAAHSAYRLFIDGELVVSNGVVSEKPELLVPNHVSRRFDGHSGSSEIVMQVANFSHAFGGPGHALMLWDSQQLNRFLDTISIIYGLVAGIIFTIGLFHLILYFADRKDENSAIHLWFSVLCLIIVYRVQGVIPLLHEYFSDTSYWSNLRYAYASLYAAPAVYLLFFRAVFREQFPKLLTNLIVVIALSGLCISLFTSEYIYTSTRNFSIWLNVFVIAYSLVFTLIAVRAKQPGSRVILGANFIFLITAIYDAIIYTDQTTGFDTTPFGILVLGVGYSYALFLRLQRTFKQGRQTSRALEKLNSELEQKVDDRTLALQAATFKAEDATREKARFIAAASHDLRQPLHALALFNNALIRKINDAEVRPLIERQESAIGNLGSLLQDTLDTAQLDIGKKPLSTNVISTEDIRDKLLNSFSATAITKQIALSIEVQPGELTSDLAMLQRILSNLLDNALKAAKAYVQVRIEQKGQQWCFEITDDGMGIAQSDIERIFESHVSLEDTNSKATGGYGLGLYVVKEFSKALGGNIALSSKIGEGATFTLSLPDQVAEESLSENANSSVPKLQLLQGIRVLAVDDDAMILDAMKFLLEAWNCDVRFAQDPDSALAIVEEFEPQLLLLDFHLQGTSGLALKTQIETKLDKAMPSLVITGATEVLIHDQLQKTKIGVLKKPVKPADLAQAIIYELQLAKPNQP